MRHDIRTAGATTLLLAALGLAGCSSTPDDAAPSSDPPPSAATSQESTEGATKQETSTITIADFEYDGPTRVAPGTKITVVNEDSAAHTLTAEDAGGFDVVVGPGESATFTAPAAGSYPYICIYHSNMSGTLDVG